MTAKIRHGIIIAIILIIAAYSLGILDPVINWLSETIFHETETHSMIQEILR